MCRSMVDIQSPTTEIRRGKKKKKKIEEERNYRMKILWSALLHRATIKNGDAQKKQSGRQVRGVSPETGRESVVGKICAIWLCCCMQWQQMAHWGQSVMSTIVLYWLWYFLLSQKFPKQFCVDVMWTGVVGDRLSADTKCTAHWTESGYFHQPPWCRRSTPVWESHFSCECCIFFGQFADKFCIWSSKQMHRKCAPCGSGAVNK